MTAEESLSVAVRDHLSGAGAMSEVRMFGGTGFMLNGNMVAAVSKRGLLLRVGKDRLPVARRNTPTPGYACFVRTQGCNWSRVLTAIAATSGCLMDQPSAVSCARGPCARYATRLRIFRTVAASHLPPRAVAMPRPLRAAAI
jgi:TfoX/Sxy family transcriptional regulator of competence genes